MEDPTVGFGVNGGVENTALGSLEALHAAVASGAQHPHAIPFAGDAFAAALQAATTPEEAAAAMAAAAGADIGADDDDGMPGSSGGLGRPRLSTGSLKNRGGGLQCQVEGCDATLVGLKEYHQRYKVCEHHLKTPYIVKDGHQVRFCQQCGRFQPLEDFDDNKRSCRVRLQRHNARRRKRPRDGLGGGGSAGDLAEYGASAAAAEMAKLAAQTYAAATGAMPGAVPISPKEVQAMHDALQFASNTLAHSSETKPAGEEAGEGAAMGPNSMPFVPTADVMMLLLKSYAAMFHYVLDGATMRALAPPSELSDPAAAAAGGLGLGGLDPLQVQQLVHAQSMFGGVGGIVPGLLGAGDFGAAGLLGVAEVEAAADAAAGQEGQQQAQGDGEQQHGQGGAAGAPGAEHQGQHAGNGALTPEQVAAALAEGMSAGKDGGVAPAASAGQFLSPEEQAAAIGAQLEQAVLAAAAQAGQDAVAAAALHEAPAE